MARSLRSQFPNEGWTLAYPPHPKNGERVPNERQALAHACPADILLYGGARGGGKTEFLATEATLNGIKYPGIQMLLVRRTRDEMKLNVLPVLRRVIPSFIAKWVKQDNAFYFHNGSVLFVDYLESEEDIGRYLGSEFGWIGVDQAEQLTEWTVLGLLSCLRSTKPWPKQLRLTANPGAGIGVPWLKEMFIEPEPEVLGNRPMPQYMQIWRPLPKDGDPTPPEHMLTRCFIPARFQDNPALMAGDPGYLARVYASFTLEKARAQAEGDWNVSDGTIVGRLWQRQRTVDAQLAEMYPDQLSQGLLIDWHVLRNEKWRPPVGSMIYGSTDYGFGVPWSFHLHAVLPGGHTRTFYEQYEAKVVDKEQAQRMMAALTQLTFADRKTPLLEGLQWIVYDPMIAGSRKENGLAKSILEVYQDEMPRVQLLAGAGGRAARMSRPGRWLDALATSPDGFPWWSVTTACPHLIRTVPKVPWDPDDPDVEADCENHCYEDTGRFFEARPHAPRVAPMDAYKHLDPVSAAHHRALEKAANPAKHGGSLAGFGRR